MVTKENMMTTHKFDIDQKVKIKDSLGGAPVETIGQEGVIVQHGESIDCYCVMFKDSYSGYDSWWYTGEELEIVT
jgi:hypothetical protein